MKDHKIHNSTPASAPAKPAVKNSPPASALSSAYRLRGNANTKLSDSPKSDSSSNGRDEAVLSSPVKSRAKSVPREAVGGRKVRVPSALNSVEEGGESVKCGGGSGNGRRLRAVVEQCAPPTRRRVDGNGVRRSEEVKKRMHELQAKVDLSENVIKELRIEVVILRTELEEARASNVELQSHNKALHDDLDASRAQIAALNRSPDQVRKESSQESQLLTLKDNQKSIACQLKKASADCEVNNGLVIDTGGKMAVDKQRGVPASPLAPPPPPLPPRHPVRRSASAHKAPAIVELYRSLSKPEARKDSSVGNSSKGVNTNVHNSIVGEIQNRSSHLMAVIGRRS